MSDAARPSSGTATAAAALRADRERAADPIGAWLRPQEKRLIVAMALLAALRVWLYAAAFPFWNNVDEPQHFDAVLKYSEGRWPNAKDSLFDSDSAAMYVLYNSPEFFARRQPGQTPVPESQIPRQIALPQVHHRISQMTELVNTESHSWPSYYLLAGGWFRLGGYLGMRGASLLYWLRFLAPPLYGLAILASWWYVRRAYASNMFLRIGTPLLLAVFPQDVFYGINADVLSPVVGAAVLAICLRVALAERSWVWYLAAGLSASVGVLIKATNCVFYVPLFLVTLVRLRNFRSTATNGLDLSRLALAWFAAVAPVVWWLARNRRYVGDWFASREKLEVLGWHVKPIHDWLDHPIFTPRGAGTFLSELAVTYWRGELIWGGDRLAWPPLDQFFLWSTAVLLVVALVFNWRERTRLELAERLANLMNVCFVAAAVLLLAALSLPFHFGPSHYPSAEHPYFTSGRLIIGTLPSFGVLYLQGIQYFVRRWSSSAPYFILTLLAAGLVLGEIYLSVDVFRSPYNWFHLID
ncbi:MAG: hypothetical protein KF708_20560 [Pirellulales bacterium]|nr:hypothetical protein [Pirellulales bacterium]